MARVLCATQPWGVILDSLGNVAAGQEFEFSVPIYTTRGGGIEISYVTNSSGEIPGYVEENTTTTAYTLEIAGREVECWTTTSQAASTQQTADADLTAIAGLSPSNDDVLQRKAGAWTNRTPAQVKTDLALTKTDVGLPLADNTSDANKPVSTATQTALDAKAPLASPVFTGNPTAPTPAAADNDTSIATTAFVQGELAAKAPLASPALTGNPTAPTAAPGDNDTSIATTAFVTAALAGENNLPGGGVAGDLIVKQSGVEGDAEWVTPEEVAAEDVPFTPAGPITATDVQEAVEQAASLGIVPPLGRFRTGRWATINIGQSSSATTLTLSTNGQENCVPFFVAEDTPFDRIALEIVTTPASAGGLVRLGIREDAAAIPGDLVLDCGTFDATATGINGAGDDNGLVIAQTLTPGVYWLSATCQGAPVTKPVVRAQICATGVPSGLVGQTTPANANPPLCVVSSNGSTGALPTTFVYSGHGGAGPSIFLRKT